MSTTDSALGAQSYRERLPGPGLARHVTCLWVQRVASGREAYRHRTVPNGGVEIVCDLGTGAAGWWDPGGRRSWSGWHRVPQ